MDEAFESYEDDATYDTYDDGDESYGPYEPSGWQIGLRVLLALVGYVALILGSLRFFYPVKGVGETTAFLLVLGAAIRPIYMLVRGSFDHIWYEDWCVERGILSRHFDVPLEMSELGFWQFCALCLASSVVGALLVLVLVFLFLCVSVVLMFFS